MPHSSTVRLVLFLAFSASLAGIVGCSSGLAVVEGTVTFDGAAVSRGMISLESPDGKGTSSGSGVENGTYRILDVQPGPKLVRISAVKVIGKGKDSEIQDSAEVEVTEELLPQKYNNATELRLDVSAPKTTHDFKLEAK